jgi:hypothetical protein
MVTVRALKPKYYLDGKIVQVGREHRIPLGEAEDMRRRGLVEIVGTPRLESTGMYVYFPPRPRR